MRKSVRKVPESQRWKWRRAAAAEDVALSSAPVVEAAPVRIETPAERVLINRWLAARIVNFSPLRCFCCKLPILPDTRWVERVSDRGRARFHSDCEPAWRAEQEPVAKRVLGIKT
jgi:hypothetical protein